MTHYNLDRSPLKKYVLKIVFTLMCVIGMLMSPLGDGFCTPIIGKPKGENSGLCAR